MTDSESTVPLSEIFIQDTGRALPVSGENIQERKTIYNDVNGELETYCFGTPEPDIFTFNGNYKEETKNMSPDELKNTLIRTLIVFGKSNSKDMIDYNTICFITSHVLGLNSMIKMSDILPLANSIDIMTKNELLTQIVFNRLYF